MSVVIDELEVVVDSPPPAPSGEAGADARQPSAQAQPAGLKPEDVRFLADRRESRKARLFAH